MALRHRALVAFVAALGAGLATGCAPRARRTGAALYEKVRRASALVLVDGRMTGCGFFADADGLVVTAAHVVRRRTKGIEVLAPAGGRQPAERVAIDLGHDVALLRVPKRDRPYPALEVVDRMPPPGSRVFLFAAPVFRHQVSLAGAVARLEPTFCYSPGAGCYARVYYIGGPSPKGTSGGCWVDRRGRVAGIQSGYLNDGKAPAGIAFACIPEAIRDLVASRRTVHTATLGTRLDELWTQPKGFIARFPKGTEGVVTVVPEKNGPVAKAGLTKESLITAIAGTPVAYVDEVLAAVRSRRPGDEVALEVMDPDRGSKRTVTVRLAEIAE